MTVVAGIEALQAQQMLDPAIAAHAGAAQSGASFAQLVGQGLNEVNQKLAATQADMQRLAVGDVQNLHEIMIRLEEAQLAFQLVLQVRNRFLEAYQDVMKMQI